MSSTAVLGFIKDISAKKIKAVEDRLKKEKPNQKYIDPAQQNLVYSLLHKAVAVGSPEIVTLLLKAGADVNSTDSRGKTPLHWLAGFKTDVHLKVAELLLKQKGINLHSQSDNKATPLHEAAAVGHTQLVHLLLTTGANACNTSSGFSALHAACQGCSGTPSFIPVVDLLLQQAPELLGQQDPSGFTPLMLLLQHGAWNNAKGFLDKGDCIVNAQGCNGESALLLACNSPAPDCQLVSALVEAGASPAVQDKATGNTPLMMAILLGGSKGLELAKALLTTSPAGPAADAAATCWLNAVNAAGESAITLAAAAAIGGSPAGVTTAKGVPAAAASLSNNGAGTSDRSAAGEMLGLLLERKPDVPGQLAATLLQKGFAGTLSDGMTAQVISLVPEYVVQQAAITAKLPQPLTFHSLLGMKLYRTAVVHLVKTTGQDPGAPQDDAGNTHLHKAVSGPEDLPDLVAALLAVGVPGNATNKDGDTALHIAARAGQLGACRALVEGCVDVTWRNGKNRTPANQLKLSDAIRSYLKEAEEAYRARKAEHDHQLWSGKMAATQTQSAFGIRVT